MELEQAPLSLLCVEPRFPGRLGAVCDWLVRKRGHRVRFFCASAEAREHWPESAGRGLDVFVFGVGGVARESAAHWTRGLERGLCYAFGCWEVLEARRPVDLVLGRSAGLGSTLFAPVHLPGTPVVNLFDYFYHAHRHDLAERELAAAPPEYFYWRRSAFWLAGPVADLLAVGCDCPDVGLEAAVVQAGPGCTGRAGPTGR